MPIKGTSSNPRLFLRRLRRTVFSRSASVALGAIIFLGFAACRKNHPTLPQGRATANGAKHEVAAGDDTGPTGAILAAAKTGDLAAVQALLKDSPELVSTRDSVLGDTPLHLAAAAGQIEVAAWLLAHGADVNARREKGGTPLHMAVGANHIDMVKLLLDNGARINAGNNTGNPPLQLAVTQNFRDMEELLLDKGADVNATNNNGGTALHVAAGLGHNEMVDLLLAKGADVNARNKNGDTPLRLALAKGHSDMADWLRHHGGRE